MLFVGRLLIFPVPWRRHISLLWRRIHDIINRKHWFALWWRHYLLSCPNITRMILYMISSQLYNIIPLLHVRLLTAHIHPFLVFRQPFVLCAHMQKSTVTPAPRCIFTLSTSFLYCDDALIVCRFFFPEDCTRTNAYVLKQLSHRSRRSRQPGPIHSPKRREDWLFYLRLSPVDHAQNIWALPTDLCKTKNHNTGSFWSGLSSKYAQHPPKTKPRHPRFCFQQSVPCLLVDTKKRERLHSVNK